MTEHKILTLNTKLRLIPLNTSIPNVVKDEAENVTREYKNSEYFVNTVSSYRVHGH